MPTASNSVCLVRGSLCEFENVCLTIPDHLKICLGIDELLSVDDIVRPGQTISSHAYDRRPGGKGANQAVALAKAGVTVRLDGTIGTDGAWMLSFIREAKVNVDAVIETPEVSDVPSCLITTRSVLHSQMDITVVDRPSSYPSQPSRREQHRALQGRKLCP
jgi:hypothetical protein